MHFVNSLNTADKVNFLWKCATFDVETVMYFYYL